jgi:peptidoglycan/LPS O-acetylase OafA/YrhL
VNKPYTKIYAVSLGVATGLMYHSIAAYKRGGRPEWSIWYRLENSCIFGLFSWTVALCSLGFVTFYPLDANKYPTKWSNLKNSLFISLSRPVFIASLMILMVAMWLNHGKRLKRILGCDLLLPYAKLSYAVYLVFPLVCSILCSSMEQSLFLSYPIMFYFLAYNMLMCFFIAFLLYLFIEAPLAAVINKFTENPDLNRKQSYMTDEST